MSRKQKSKQPHLAAANMPFTPMTHKVDKSNAMATPFRPLQLNDLATPKINKSHSSADKEEMQIAPKNQEKQQPQQYQPTGDSNQDDKKIIKELKQTLYICLQVVEKLEANASKPKKTYHEAQTQTSPPPPKIPSGKVRKPTPGPENMYNMNQIDVSDKYAVKPKKQQSIDMQSSKNSISISANDTSENDLQEKMRAMSILLQKLQNRIDDIDSSSQK
ncbi:hypothetical protein TRFO_08462 [Tritrichomonas foetus]|uniref:Uncharacterized protein n=1 Tax=Tritrichomonas foetus TaxID=1144522 RepID=A0A1J4JNX3_9EUKA|nr:hypothetical protein TRFO_08462 [Tritrichomonas foetus]|eukprot:OHS99221.1 hypothetical protein TRFO_08462 [Tritrichomonas foetus]